MPAPSEKPDTAGKDSFAAKKSAGQQTVVVKAKDPDLQFIPILVKHMTLAIFEHKFGGGSGDGAGGSELNAKGGERSAKPSPSGKNFAEAFAIARGRLADYRHLTAGSKNGPIGKITLTGSGRQLESNHRRETGGSKKTARFDSLYMKFLAKKPETVPEKRGGA